MKGHKPGHLVQRVKLEFEIQNQSEAGWFQNEMSRLFNAYLQKSLEKILDEFDVDGYVIRLDQIDLDLGEVLLESMDKRIPKLFEEKLRKALVDKIGLPNRRFPAPPSKDVQVLALFPAKLEMIKRFLTTGHTTYGHKAGNKTMEEVFQELIERDEAEVYGMLVEATRENRQVLERIAYQFHARSFELIYKLFAPSYRSFILAQEATLVGLITTKVTQHHGTAVRAVRKAILTYLFKKGKGSFETTEFRKEVSVLLMDQLGEGVKAIFEEIAELQIDQGKASESEQRRFEDAMQVMMAFLQASNLPADRMLLIQAWEFLSLEVPKRLSALIAKSRPTTKQILTLIDILPPVAVQEFVERALPSHSGPISMILAEVVAVFQAYASPQAGIAEVRNQTMAQLLLYTAQLAEKPQEFSPREAVKRIQQELQSNLQIPKELKKALERADLPGISDLLRDDLQPISPSAEENASIASEEERKAFESAKARFQVAQDEVIDLTDDSVTDPEVKRRRTEKEKLLEEDERFIKDHEAALANAEVVSPETESDRIEVQSAQNESELTQDAPLVGKEPTFAEGVEKEGVDSEEKDKTKAKPDQPTGKHEDHPQEETTKEPKGQKEQKEQKGQKELADTIEEGTTQEERPIRKPTEQRTTEVPISEKSEVEEFLTTVAGRIDYLSYVLRHGEEPWWAGPKDSSRFELILSSLTKVSPDGLKAMFQNLAAGQLSAALDPIAARLHEQVGGSLLVSLLTLILPDVGGFSAVIREVMQTFVASPPPGLVKPSYLRETRGLVFHHLIKFALLYQSSTPTAQALVHYLAQEVGEATGLGSRNFIRELTLIMDDRIGKGERKFLPFKTLLPMSFQPIVVPPPAPVSPTDSGVTYLSATEVMALEAEWAAEMVAATEKQTTSVAEGEEILEPESREQELGIKEIAKHEAEQDPEVPGEFEEKAKQERIEAKAAQEQELLRDAFTFEQQTPREGEAYEANQESQEGDQYPENLSIQDVEQGELEAEAARQELAAILAEQQAVKLPRVLRYLRNPEDGVKIVKHFLESGTMRGDFPAAISKSDFNEMVEYLLVHHKVTMMNMLKKVVADRTVRLRIVRELKPFWEKIMHVLSPWIADVMLPYVVSISSLMESSSAPTHSEVIYEHALAYAVRVRGEIFSPLDYVRSLIQYTLNQMQVEPRSLVSWLETRLDQRDVPQRFGLQQVLQTVRATSAPPKPKDDEKEKAKPAKFRPLEEDFFVSNAGVVLVWPFFGQLFTFLKLLNPDKKSFVDDLSQAKAAHLIQYLFSKEINAPEESMTLNKVLVGMKPEDPLMEIDELTDEEKELVEEMLGVAAERSGLVKGPHGDALRETFMEREGRLKKEKEGWSLKVEAKAYDLLLGRLQWGLNPVRMPWITTKFQIDWK